MFCAAPFFQLTCLHFGAGVVRTLHARSRLDRCFCTETRPYNQGARLTAYELVHDGIPSTLVCDDMVAALMKCKGIDAVFTGADRYCLLDAGWPTFS